jgi:GTP cyclohydrolase I
MKQSIAHLLAVQQTIFRSHCSMHFLIRQSSISLTYIQLEALTALSSLVAKQQEALCAACPAKQVMKLMNL